MSGTSRAVFLMSLAYVSHTRGQPAGFGSGIPSTRDPYPLDPTRKPAGSLANSFVRGAGHAFKSLIYIAINSTGPNLRFKGVVEDPNDPLTSDSELGSGEEGGTGASDEVTDSSHRAKKQKDDDMVSDHEVKYKGERGKGKAFEPEPRFREANGKEKAHDSEVSSGAEGHFDGTYGLDPDEIHGDRKGKGKAKVSQWSHSLEFFEDIDAKPVSSEHLQVHRLLKNMTKSKNATWSDEESDAGEDDLEQWEQQPLPINHL
ncbi:hypothetical protein B0H10DRAFT_1966607 [Mycena sp. CBHHK59/15]|nr:hypothetical protein B0H10DRAFT_1966607 [Mycena sp. CBHHK59/15]